MALNQNHTFDELDGTKCSIVEKNCSAERVTFLKNLLLYNNYTVVVAKSPPPKAPAPSANPDAPAPPPPPETYTVGVTDLTFNSTNAVFGRLLHSTDGHVVTLNYWQQKETMSQETIPYFEAKR